jgi:hypothetical protein
VHTYHKHLFAYVPPTLRIAIVATIIYLIFHFNAAGRILVLAEVSPATSVYFWVYWWGDAAGAVILLIPVLGDIYRILVLRSTSISIDPDGVDYHSGILPWNTHTHYWRPFQIFSSSFSQPGFFNWVFSKGSVTITGKEGITSNFTVTSLFRPKQCSIEINKLIKQ